MLLSRCEFILSQRVGVNSLNMKIFFMVHLYLSVPNNYLLSTSFQYEFANLD